VTCAACRLPVSDDAAVTVVLAGADYPERADSGTPIEGIADAEATGALVFHAGTALHEGHLVTNGGRILNVTARGETIAAARAARIRRGVPHRFRRREIPP